MDRYPDHYGKQPTENEYFQRMRDLIGKERVPSQTLDYATDLCRRWNIPLVCRFVLALELHQQYESGFAHAVDGWSKEDRERWWKFREQKR